MSNMVNVYFYGKHYSVPGDLTIMTAMEYAGYTLKRGCGCRHGFCGACATIYRIKGSNELKTKPTQHSVKELLSLGIQPNIIVLRSECEVPVEMREKIALFCNVRKEDVIQNLTASSLYAVPLMLESEGLAHSACYHLGLEDRQPDLTEWENMVHRQENSTKPLTIGIVGK